jgi:exonuclease III
LSIIIKSIYKIKFDCDINEIRNELDSQADISCIKLTNPTLCSGILNRSMNTDDSLCVATVNIRSVNRNLDRFLIFLSQLGMDIDIIVLTECWLSDGALIPLLDNYYSFNTTHNINQNDGVIAYVKNTLSVTGYEPIKEDGNFLVLEIENKVSVICTYRPPCYHNPTNYINSIHEILCKIKCNTIILTGDVNLDIMPENITGYSAEYMNMLAYHGLRQCINIETRNKSCLDHFMVKCKKNTPIYCFRRIYRSLSNNVVY